MPTCWPISALAMFTVTLPVVSISNHTLGAKVFDASASFADNKEGRAEAPKAMSNEVFTDPTIKERRERLTMSFFSLEISFMLMRSHLLSMRLGQNILQKRLRRV